MRKFLTFLPIFASIFLEVTMSQATAAPAAHSAYDFSLTTLMGEEPLPLSQFKGKVLLVVNTASKCGYTPQYSGLEGLYNHYKGRGLVVLGVPANDFGAQEPGTASEIAEFCRINFGVTFPMASKQVVVGGNAHPFYQWLAATMGPDNVPKWNFSKYLIDSQGKPVAFFPHGTRPDAPELTGAIEKLLP